MWLPKPIYERVPQFWMLTGLMMIATGTYLGFENPLAFVYFGLGFFSCAWSMCTFAMRLVYRRHRFGKRIQVTTEIAEKLPEA
jgi:hypothetical protein